jgi:hypothetical protein
MQRWIVLTLGLVLVAVLWTLPRSFAADNQGAVKETRQKWEYAVLVYGERAKVGGKKLPLGWRLDTEEIGAPQYGDVSTGVVLNKMAAEGWELDSVPEPGQIIFKRPKQ